MIRFSTVSKIFPGDAPGLVDINAEISDGSFVFLIGPSGSGKTTFLRLLFRDLLPTSGSIHIDDVELNTLQTKKIHFLRRKVSVVFQDFKLLSDRTIYENIAIVPEILGKSDKEISHSVTNVLSLVGLPHKRDMFPAQLSAGELQRISIARAIVGGPKILLADEPTGNLDPDTSWGILSILDQINAMGTTVIMATHNADIVNKLKKRTITLHKGKIIHDEEKGKYHIIKMDKKDEQGESEDKKDEDKDKDKDKDKDEDKHDKKDHDTHHSKGGHHAHS